jgi:hypothetical protein
VIDSIGKHHSGEAEFWAGWRESTEVVSFTVMQNEVDSEHSIVLGQIVKFQRGALVVFSTVLCIITREYYKRRSCNNLN